MSDFPSAAYDRWRLQSPPEQEHDIDCPCHEDKDPDDDAECRCQDIDEYWADQAAESILERAREED